MCILTRTEEVEKQKRNEKKNGKETENKTEKKRKINGKETEKKHKRTKRNRRETEHTLIYSSDSDS